MKLALDEWGPQKPLALRMLAQELATGTELVYDLRELARQGQSVEGGRRSDPPKPDVAPFVAAQRWQTA
jgi:hypothetical protein